MHKQAKDSLEPDSSLLVKQAVWCGCVFSLAALISVLNCLPPVGIHFRVRAQVVASPERIEALKQKLHSDRISPDACQDTGILLCSLAVLDQARKPTSAIAAPHENVKLIEVHSRWSERASTASIRAWLESISQVRESQPIETSVTKQHRVAKWQLQAAEHYLAHHLHTSATSLAEQPEVANTAPEVDSDNAIPKLSTKNQMRLVGIIRPQSPSTSLTSQEMANASETRETDQTRGQLEEHLAAAREAARQAAMDREKMEASIAGVLAISGSPYIRAEPGSMPWWLAASVLVLALASGSCAGWLKYRLQSGGAFEPETVAAQLAADGLAVVDRLNLTPVLGETRDWLEATGRRATKLSRRLACGMTSVSEWVVLSWCCVIALRFFLDPLWRNVFVDSPLAGIGRLIVGLP